jgi:hypothetical protein
MNELPQFLRDMLACPPKHGDNITHNWIFRVNRHLHAHRSKEDIFRLIRGVLIDRSDVPDSEIKEAVNNSEKCAWRPKYEANGDWKEPDKKRPQFDQAHFDKIVKLTPWSVDAWIEHSPVRFDPDTAPTEEILDILFPGDPLVCVGWDKRWAITERLSEFKQELDTAKFIVPNPMSAKTGINQKGKESARCLDNTGTRRFLVVELDRGTLDQQASVIRHIQMRNQGYGPRLVLIIFSGGKSLHSWFYVPAFPDKTLKDFLDPLVRLGADPQMLVKCQFARMPGGKREGGATQKILYWNPGAIDSKYRSAAPENADEGKSSLDDDLQQETEEPQEPKIYIEILSPKQLMDYDPPENLVLIGDHHIGRGDVFVIGGPPGVGKSRATLAFAEAGATKYEWFGLTTHCNFKTLIIQNENGRYRLKRELEEIDEPKLENYLRICPPPPYGLCLWEKEFRDQLRACAELFGPEAVIFDPWNALARDEKARDYLETFGIIRDVFPQGDDGPAIGIACHTHKPKQGERANGRALLNLLSGSYVLGSVPRCVFVMQHASDDVSETRIVWTCCKNNDGEPGLRGCWERQNGLFTLVNDFDWKAWDQGEKQGAAPLEAVAEILRKTAKGLRKSKLAAAIEDKMGVKRATAYRRIDAAQKAGLIDYDEETNIYTAKNVSESSQ